MGPVDLAVGEFLVMTMGPSEGVWSKQASALEGVGERPVPGVIQTHRRGLALGMGFRKNGKGNRVSLS